MKPGRSGGGGRGRARDRERERGPVSRMLAPPPRERRTREGGEKPSRDTTAPRAHRPSCSDSSAQDRSVKKRRTPVGSSRLAEDEEAEETGGERGAATLKLP
ncbi:unnamed protein product [Pleuronectes platessa]|uniref:Uncharacterized protein n=1 Tax=Pleuronectes platessa TaxID=8262 RepID=A0A9N7ZF04_PLEPL|nr:unnamed protein product [Pleuronectes platessa]